MWGCLAFQIERDHLAARKLSADEVQQVNSAQRGDFSLDKLDFSRLPRAFG
jgi:hypothetical protein